MRRLGATLVAVCSALVGAFGAPPVAAHEGIAGSDPTSGSQLEAPIDRVEIDFGAVIADDVELVLLDPDDDEVPSTTTRTGDTTAAMTFDEIDREGTYIVRYLTSVPTDGHVIAGAIQFSYGTADGSSMSTGWWLVFAVFAAVVIAVGAWSTLRRWRAADADPVEAGITDR